MTDFLMVQVFLLQWTTSRSLVPCPAVWSRSAPQATVTRPTTVRRWLAKRSIPNQCICGALYSSFLLNHTQFLVLI